MSIFSNCKKIFLDFDGVVVNSNKFKEKAIEKSVFMATVKNQRCIDAIDYFNINAGISRYKKLSKFFNQNEIDTIMKIYSKECNNFFNNAVPTIGLNTFLDFIKRENRPIKIYILSGGEKSEIKSFLKKNNLNKYFEDILASEKSKFDHLKYMQAKENDIFIGDSKNDLKVSIQIGLKFILFEEYKSLKSFPSQKLINENASIRTNNFQTLINNFIS